MCAAVYLQQSLLGPKLQTVLYGSLQAIVCLFWWRCLLCSRGALPSSKAPLFPLLLFSSPQNDKSLRPVDQPLGNQTSKS